MARQHTLKPMSGFVLGLGLTVLPGLLILHRELTRADPQTHGDYAPPPNLVQDAAFRIVAFGSSSTRGYGASSEAMTYPSQLGARLQAHRGAGDDVEVVNRGVNGEDIDDMMRRLDDDILPRKPDLVIWQLGSNDAIHGVEISRFRQHLRDGIARIRAAGGDVVLMDPQWAPTLPLATVQPYIDAVHAAGRELSVDVVGRYALMLQWLHDGRATKEDLVGPDGLHMTDHGYALLGQAVYEAILARIDAPRTRTRPPGAARASAVLWTVDAPL